MVIFEIKDGATNEGRLLGYLFYYERSRRFFAELLRSLDEWTAPFLFSGFVKRGIYSIDSEWSMKFVRQRIIPPDRQNLGAVLKDNKLREYDEYKLLQLSEGRCAQDEICLAKCAESDLDPEIRKRMTEKVKDVLPMEDRKAIVFFMDDKSRLVDVGRMCADDRRFANILRDAELFRNVAVSPGGNGIEWGEERFLPADVLRHAGEKAHLDHSALLAFVTKRVLDTTEAAAELSCSRQYIGQLASKGRLSPIKSGSNNSLFLKSDIERE
ncbi:MAG: helix-turn-helix domain-containing protein [Lachnospiraceae bacterium]|nr:helix-turn-helix domain-containing protein [Lachnospiraceae bacterium]